MPRLILFFVCLTVLGFSASARVGLALGAVTAAVWALCIAVMLAQLLRPPRR
ncbi:MAG: hypothetical protein QM788_05310 [Roseateles sp.]|uniref:hypothetical protein n=1 Tax=Roseateles sp. TaxID=1971397 RepID=UPI0039E75614